MLVIFCVSCLKLLLISFIGFHRFPNFFGIFVWSIGDVSALLIKLFFYAILANIILSWVSPNTHSPVTSILNRLSEPLLRPARKYIPPIGGFDISPIPVLIGLQILIILITDPLSSLGYYWSAR